MKKKNNSILIIIFFLTLMLPVYGKLLDGNIVLNGVTAESGAEPLSGEGLQEGTWQTGVSDLWDRSFPGRKLLMKVRNQLLYSIFHVSPNSNVIIGKDGSLFEPEYVSAEDQAIVPASEEYFEELTDKLARLDALCKENAKELYVFITPSKAQYMWDQIPDRILATGRQKEFTYTDYERFLETLDKSGVPYFDSIEYIDTHLEDTNLKAPVFYKSGIHWSHSWGRTCAAELIAMINRVGRYDLSTIAIKEKPSAEPVSPDVDLYSSLNLLFDAKEDWYDTDTVVEKEGSDKPSVFIRGGSFLGQSIGTMIRADVFGSDVYLENNYWFHDKFSETKYLSGFTAYDELPLDYLVGKSDILILEVNKAKIQNMDWEFIDYLLEHPDYLDDEYTEGF